MRVPIGVMVIRRSKKYALFVLAAFIAGQLIGVFHSHEVHAATDNDPCTVCQISQDLAQADIQSDSDPAPVIEKIDETIEGVDFLQPREIPDSHSPRTPLFRISI